MRFSATKRDFSNLEFPTEIVSRRIRGGRRAMPNSDKRVNAPDPPPVVSPRNGPVATGPGVGTQKPSFRAETNQPAKQMKTNNCPPGLRPLAQSNPRPTVEAKNPPAPILIAAIKSSSLRMLKAPRSARPLPPPHDLTPGGGDFYGIASHRRPHSGRQRPGNLKSSQSF